eukprot:scaffold111206_cov13-Tisochrysis_lutea.AAC.1
MWPWSTPTSWSLFAAGSKVTLVFSPVNIFLLVKIVPGKGTWMKSRAFPPQPRFLAGGKVTVDFSKVNTYLLVANASGKKYEAAVKWGIPA